jgi:glycosyltransferase involved in cell wall biosynthesis
MEALTRGGSAGSARPSISVILITRDEEARLERTLESVAWADELVIVDSGSTDRTEEVAHRFGARFVVAPWEGFGRQKQHALDLATGEWVLSIDADEVVTPELRLSIEEAVRRPGGAVGFSFQLYTDFFGVWMGSRGWYREWKLRLFRRDRARFDHSVVHEGIQLDGSVRRIGGVLLHYHFRGLDHQVEKLNRYTSWTAERRFASGTRSGSATPFVRGVASFLKSFLLQGRFLYGRVGLVSALFTGADGFLKYAKLWEMQRAREADATRPESAESNQPTSPRSNSVAS